MSTMDLSPDGLKAAGFDSDIDHLRKDAGTSRIRIVSGVTISAAALDAANDMAVYFFDGMKVPVQFFSGGSNAAAAHGTDIATDEVGT
jgi:hypothetical protein